ncbi:MAG: hypothetical protein ABS52_04435 [Gemmatimonadetes bacterium SCN 70-22]|nr:MAG: hypothetical protein ABS52_04435 [Gemmatimonadetes bacterium SCN 70-22]
MAGEREDARTRAPDVQIHRPRPSSEDVCAAGGDASVDVASRCHSRVASQWPTVLLLATLATTTWSGALHQRVNLMAELLR